MKRTLLIVGLLVICLGGVAGWYLTRPRPLAGPAPLTGDARQYVRNLGLADVEMKATESLMSGKVVEILGNISNKGDRKLRLVEINCVFYDLANNVVLRERVPIVRPRSGGLAPGETKSFRLPFDSLPDTWNVNLPQLVIAQIEFE